MTDNINKLMAEALVECGYGPQYKSAEQLTSYERAHVWEGAFYISTMNGWPVVDPFADTLEGRRQADVLEDYFEQRPALWELWNSFPRPYIYDVGESMREWRLDHIKWCFEQLAEQS